MNTRFISIFFTFFISLSPVIAAQNTENTSLSKEREQVIEQYIDDLQKADAQDISTLFAENGIVVSTSKGKVSARDFFYSFLPEIEFASTELHGFFSNGTAVNHYAARFHFSFNLKDGEQGEGEYVDEFIFAPNSSQLVAVYMFENLHFSGISD